MIQTSYRSHSQVERQISSWPVSEIDPLPGSHSLAVRAPRFGARSHSRDATEAQICFS
ncbi:hypothetical protein BVI1335_990017 [Burkholderia vietnamiensis]|nr:hypothetical protein BVI1335_990017 [Burkholderia vietnamiensis]